MEFIHNILFPSKEQKEIIHLDQILYPYLLIYFTSFHFACTL